MHIFVTGGTGFFGKALLRYLTDTGLSEIGYLRLTLLSRDPVQFQKDHGELLNGLDVKLAVGDILSPETLPPGDYSHILHAATDSTYGPKLKPLQRYEQIVDGTQNILNFAVAQKVKRILLTSSGGVYGEQPADMPRVSESYNGMPDPLNPQNTYSVAKRFAEHLCVLYKDQYDIDIVIARCFAFVGRDLPLSSHFAIGNFINDALSADTINVSGDGTPLRSYMDQRDLARWLFAILLKGETGNAYNVGSDHEISIQNLAKLVRDVLSPSKEIRINRAPGLVTFRNRYIPSIEKAKKDLNLELKYTLLESLNEIVRIGSCLTVKKSK
jgi:dTDP-glucose 4,6-dehydratase